MQTNHGTCSQQIEQTDCRLSKTGDGAGHRILWNNGMLLIHASKNGVFRLIHWNWSFTEMTHEITLQRTVVMP